MKSTVYTCDWCHAVPIRGLEMISVHTRYGNEYDFGLHYCNPACLHAHSVYRAAQHHDWSFDMPPNTPTRGPQSPVESFLPPREGQDSQSTNKNPN